MFMQVRGAGKESQGISTSQKLESSPKSAVHHFLSQWIVPIWSLMFIDLAGVHVVSLKYHNLSGKAALLLQPAKLPLLIV